jgi:hypothetical protein
MSSKAHLVSMSRPWRRPRSTGRTSPRRHRGAAGRRPRPSSGGRAIALDNLLCVGARHPVGEHQVTAVLNLATGGVAGTAGRTADVPLALDEPQPVEVVVPSGPARTDVVEREVARLDHCDELLDVPGREGLVEPVTQGCRVALGDDRAVLGLDDVGALRRGRRRRRAAGAAPLQPAKRSPADPSSSVLLSSASTNPLSPSIARTLSRQGPPRRQAGRPGFSGCSRCGTAAPTGARRPPG